MRLGYRLSFALIAASVLVTTLFGVLAMRDERRDLINTMKHETWITVATLQPAIEFALVRRDSTQVRELLDGLGHQRILGAAIFHPDGSLIIGSTALPVTSAPEEPDVHQVLAETEPAHAFIDMLGERVYAYSVPLLDQEGNPHAVLAVYHLTGYLEDDLARERLVLLVTLLAGSVITAGLVFFIVNRAVSRPIDGLIRKVTALRRGEFPGAVTAGEESSASADAVEPGAAPAASTPVGEPTPEPGPVAAAPVAAHVTRETALQPNGQGDELGRLAHEFDRMAENLERSREALIEEAGKRIMVERGLRRFDRMATLGQLTSNLAHEVGTPLGVLRGRAEFLLSEVSDRPEARREVEIIIAQIDRITRTIERFLSVSRTSPHAPERIVGDELVREAAALVDLECRRQGIRLTVEPNAGDLAIRGQRDGFMQVLLNMAVNGLQAMAEGGELRIASRPAELRGIPALEFEVSDNGSGIPEEIKKQIFEPFFSTRGTTGLGLFISHSIVREHGGVTVVESEPGRGSTFTVRIPVTEQDEGGGDAPTEGEDPAGAGAASQPQGGS